MKTVIIEKPGLVSIVDEEKPKIEDDEVQLKVIYVGLCGSDLSSFQGKNPMVKYPVIPGHEIAAEVAETGLAVPSSIKIGSKVTVNPYTNCGQCAACKTGRINACQFNETMGVQRNGAMQEFVSIHWKKLILEDSLTNIELALTEPLSVGFHAISRGRVDDTDTVLILGCGMIGAGAIIRASLRGAQVIAVDIDDKKLSLAKDLGANYVINSATEDINEKLLDLCAGLGPQVIIEAAGNPATYLAAMDLVSFCGRVVCIGYAKADIAFATRIFVQKELDILGSRNALQEDIEAVVAYLKRKTCPVNALVSKIITPDKLPEALADWSEHPGQIMKIMVKVTED